LHTNHLHKGGDFYQARVVYQRVVVLSEVNDMMTLHGSSLTRADMLAVFEVFLQVLLRLLLQGARVVTPFGEFGLTIKGNFESAGEQFNARQHRIEIHIKPGERLAGDFKRQAKVQKTEATLPHPTPQDCTNLADPEAAADHLIPGQMARVSGHNLKFDPADPEQGVFLIPLKAGSDSERSGPAIRVGSVGHNKSRQLLFVVPPELAPGSYRLEVRAVFGRSSLRAGQLPQVLRVP
jgi:hypothetical protein